MTSGQTLLLYSATSGSCGKAVSSSLIKYVISGIGSQGRGWLTQKASRTGT